MTWVFVQRTGAVYGPSGTLAFLGYSGNGPDKDNPASEFVKDHGPIPVGWYTMGTPVEDSHLGPCAIPLIPDVANDMGGRAGFWWHDDSVQHPGAASDGCLVTIGSATRRQAWASPSHRLQVVADTSDLPVPILPTGAHT